VGAMPYLSYGEDFSRREKFNATLAWTTPKLSLPFGDLDPI